MNEEPSERQTAIRAIISDFLTDRLNTKLQTLADADPRRDELLAQFVYAIWLEDAARRVGQIQAVTHSLKPIHPEARGSSLYRNPASLHSSQELGSHSLGATFTADVVGNAAALDVNKFLNLEYEGRSLLSLASDADADLAAALSDDAGVAARWMDAFKGIASPRGVISTHTLAKQLFWPVSDNPQDDTNGYHLLAPLYPTSLVHQVYQTLQEDRFGEPAKAARAARKEGAWSDRPVREYSQLAIQKLGGTKPQNISQLNSERRGENYLLASLPPVWQSQGVKPLFGVTSMFDSFRRRSEVRAIAKQLRRFLESDPARNLETRMRRDEMVESLLDEFVQFTSEVRELESGWAADPQCDLSAAHAHWLDPLGAHVRVAELENILAGDFANSLNAQLRNPLPMGDVEYLHWRKQARDVITEMLREADDERE